MTSIVLAAPGFRQIRPRAVNMQQLGCIVVDVQEESAEDLQRRFEAEALPLLDQLFGSALALTRNRSDAEDLTQEVFLRAFAAFDTYQPGTNIRAWLYRILTNAYVSAYRKESRDLQHIGEPLPLDWQLTAAPGGDQGEGGQALSPQFSPSAESEALRRMESQEAYALLARLPTDQRTALYLVDVVGLTSREAADILEIPQGTVTSRVHRGRQRLRQIARQAQALRSALPGSSVGSHGLATRALPPGVHAARRGALAAGPAQHMRALPAGRDPGTPPQSAMADFLPLSDTPATEGGAHD